LTVADISRRTSGSVRKTAGRAVVFETGLAAVTRVVVSATRHAQIVIAARIVATSRIVTAALLAKTCFADSTRSTAGVLGAGLATFIFDTALPRKAVRVVTAASQTLILDAAFTVCTLPVFPTTFLATVLKADLPPRTGVIIRTAPNTLSITTKGSVAAGDNVVIPTTAGLTIILLADRTHSTIGIVTAGRATEVIHAALSRTAVAVVAAIPASALRLKAKLPVGAALIISTT